MHTRAIDIRASPQADTLAPVDGESAKANPPTDRQWVEAALAFLRLYADDLGSELGMYMADDDKAEYVSKVVTAMVEAAGTLDAGEYLGVTYRMRY
jgi:hypothetical protein